MEWHDAKAFGRILRDRPRDPIFVHQADVLDGLPLVKGQRVVFVSREDRYKPGRIRATMVEPEIPIQFDEETTYG